MDMLAMDESYRNIILTLKRHIAAADADPQYIMFSTAETPQVQQLRTDILKPNHVYDIRMIEGLSSHAVRKFASSFCCLNCCHSPLISTFTMFLNSQVE